MGQRDLGGGAPTRAEARPDRVIFRPLERSISQAISCESRLESVLGPLSSSGFSSAVLLAQPPPSYADRTPRVRSQRAESARHTHPPSVASVDRAVEVCPKPHTHGRTPAAPGSFSRYSHPSLRCVPASPSSGFLVSQKNLSRGQVIAVRNANCVHQAAAVLRSPAPVSAG